MNIGFDLDGVLYPWHDSIYSYFTQYKGYNGSYTQFWAEDWKKPEYQDYIGYLVTVPLFYEDREPFVGALDVLNKIDKAGHNIYYITYRPPETITTTEHYLDRHKFPQKNNLYVSDDKAMIARSLDLNLFIDDREKYVAQVEPICMSVLMARPWNLSSQEKFPTIYNISEFMKFVGE